jgi:hypothetical protein
MDIITLLQTASEREDRTVTSKRPIGLILKRLRMGRMAEKSFELENEQADLWAAWFGFNDSDEMKNWGAEQERARLA